MHTGLPKLCTYSKTAMTFSFARPCDALRFSALFAGPGRSIGVGPCDADNKLLQEDLTCRLGNTCPDHNNKHGPPASLAQLDAGTGTRTARVKLVSSCTLLFVWRAMSAWMIYAVAGVVKWSGPMPWQLLRPLSPEGNA